MKNQSAMLMKTAMVVIGCFLAVSNTSASVIPFTPSLYTDTLNNSYSSGEPYLRLNEINIRAARSFEKMYPEITTQKWLKISSGYLVKFTDKGIPTHIYFDKKGNTIIQTRYFNELNMPVAVKKALMQSYPGYTIGVVTEASTIKATFFHVDIRNDHLLKTVRVHGSEIELINENKI